MGKTAFLYAGQGSQRTGMGKDFYEIYPEFRRVFDSADLDFDIHEICFHNPDNLLLRTEYTQPCMVAYACGVTAVLRERKILPDYVCGLSLGEYSALHAAGVWDAKTAIETVALRGRAMAEASRGIKSGMTAIISLDEGTTQSCCDQAGRLGVVAITNYNCPGQIVIGGEKAAVDEAARLCKEAGAKRCLSLAVSGPFHTCLMESAGEVLREYFRKIEFKPMTVPVLFNCLGREANERENISDLLVQQVKSTVKMGKCIKQLFDLGVDRFIEIGPGTTLSGFVKKVGKEQNKINFEICTIEKDDDIRKL